MLNVVLPRAGNKSYATLKTTCLWMGSRRIFLWEAMTCFIERKMDPLFTAHWRNISCKNKSGFIYLQVAEIPLCVGRSRLGRRKLGLGETPSWLDFVHFWSWGCLGSLILMKMILFFSSVLSFSKVSQSTLCIMSYFAIRTAFAVDLMVVIWDQSWGRTLLWSNARYTSRGWGEVNWDSWMRCV